MVLHSKNMSINNRRKPKPHSSRTSHRAASNKFEIDLDSLLSKNHKHGAKPKNLKELDQILDAFKNVQNEEDLKTLLEPSDDKKTQNLLQLNKLLILVMVQWLLNRTD